MNQKLSNKIINISKDLRYTSTLRAKHFSFIVKRNTIVSVGINSYDKTHPMAKKLGYRFANIHSELSAVLNFDGIPSDLMGCDLINVRMNRFGQIGMSKPCSKCQKLIRDFGFSKVYYTDWNGKFTQFS